MEPTTMGIAMAFLAAFFWGCNNVLVRKASESVDPFIGAYLTLWVNLAFVLAALAVFGGWASLYRARWQTMALFIVVGLLQYPIARLAFYFSIRYIGAARASGITGIQPLFTAMVAVLVLGETITLRLALGTLLTMAGIYLLMSEGGKRDG